MTQSKHEEARSKLARIPVKIEMTTDPLPKPDWIRVKLSHSKRVSEIKASLRERKLVSVCEEASCPNLSECFSHGTATFMIMGDVCTRRCTFCDVKHGRPDQLDADEPQNLADTILQMGLSYVVITSVDRDDLRDGGAGHFVDCIRAVRAKNPDIQIEILVPDFRGRLDKALNILHEAPPDVFNHNLETVPHLYRQVRPGSDYQHSLKLLQDFKAQHPDIPTKSGIMVGLGETFEQIVETLEDLNQHQVNMLTIGQYLQPSPYHSPVERYMPPSEFDELKRIALKLGFDHVASGPMVRSSYHADRQARGETVS